MQEFHKIDLQKLQEEWNPFDVWEDATTKEQMIRLIAEKIEYRQVLRPSIAKVAFEKSYCSLQMHASRIAWFILNWAGYDPICIDFSNTHFEVVDGNHRLCAAIYLQKLWILSSCSGSIDYIKEFEYKESN